MAKIPVAGDGDDSNASFNFVGNQEEISTEEAIYPSFINNPESDISQEAVPLAKRARASFLSYLRQWSDN